MGKTTYQSRYKTVLVECDVRFNVCRLYVSTVHERFASWYVGRRAVREWAIDRAAELLAKAATIAPVFHGTVGPVAQITQISTGAYN